MHQSTLCGSIVAGGLVFSAILGCGAEVYRVDAAFNRGASGDARHNGDVLTPIDLQTFKFLEDRDQPGTAVPQAARTAVAQATAQAYKLETIAKLGTADSQASQNWQFLRDIDTQATTETTVLSEKSLTAYAKATASPSARNRLLAHLLEHSDRIYAHHMASVHSAQNNLNSSFDILTLTTSGLAAVFTPVVTKTALATTAAISSGVQGSINDRFFVQLLAPRIFQETANARLAMRQEIERHRDEGITQYTVDDMLRDVQEYHERGSFMYGVMLLATSTGRTEIGDSARLSALDDKNARVRVANLASLAAGADYVVAKNAEESITIVPADRAAGTAITRIEITLKESEAFVAELAKVADEGARTTRRNKDRDRTKRILVQFLKSSFRDVGDFDVTFVDPQP